MLLATTTTVAFSDHTAAILVLGAVVPLAGYLINNGLPRWKAVSEELKAILHVVLAAAAGYVYTWWQTPVHGAGNISTGALVAVISALFSHSILWKPAGVNVRFGAEDTPPKRTSPS